MTALIIIERDLNLLINAIDFHESTQGASNWIPADSETGRRSNEKRRNDECVNAEITVHEVFETKTKTHKIRIEQSYSESYSNVQVISNFYYDERETTLTKLKNIITENIKSLALDFEFVRL